MTLPNTIATFFASILLFSLKDTTRARCSTIAFRVAWCTGGNLRILDLSSMKLFDLCSTAYSSIKKNSPSYVRYKTKHLFLPCAEFFQATEIWTPVQVIPVGTAEQKWAMAGSGKVEYVPWEVMLQRRRRPYDWIRICVRPSRSHAEANER